MAILESFEFTGPLGNLSAYRMRGSDKIILRKKGGATKEKIKTAPEFENTRRINAEFSGRSRATRYILRALHPLKSLADHNISGPLNALLKPVQALDTESEWGKRHVLLSRNPRMMEGFSLNRNTLLESTVRPPLACTISRESLSAQVTITALVPGINFFLHQTIRGTVFGWCWVWCLIFGFRMEATGSATSSMISSRFLFLRIRSGSRFLVVRRHVRSTCSYPNRCRTITLVSCWRPVSGMECHSSRLFSK